MDTERPAFDTSIAHHARIYDYLLGGKDNYAADRTAGDALIAAYPTMVELAQANRAFLGRVVRFLAGEAGIRQFLDIGTGIPAAGNTHQVAQEVAPDSRVVYVDYDPVVLAHARALLAGSPHGATDYIDADARNVAAILEQAARTLDFSRPVAAVSLLTLHAISDSDNPYSITARIMDAVPPGSYLAITHPASDIEPDKVSDLQTRVNKLSHQQYTGRSHDQVMRFFAGLELVEPGLVQVHQWRPAIQQTRTLALWAGVARKPRTAPG
jgi:S-adenosyl methyltransferase